MHILVVSLPGAEHWSARAEIFAFRLTSTPKLSRALVRPMHNQLDTVLDDPIRTSIALIAGGTAEGYRESCKNNNQNVRPDRRRPIRSLVDSWA